MKFLLLGFGLIFNTIFLEGSQCVNPFFIVGLQANCDVIEKTFQMWKKLPKQDRYWWHITKRIYDVCEYNLERYPDYCRQKIDEICVSASRKDELLAELMPRLYELDFYKVADER